MKISTNIIWNRGEEENFLNGQYKRTHQWIMEGGMILNASASPEIVPIPMSDPALIDPEEAFVSSVSSCHMLFFLSIAAKKKLVIDSYQDNPIATMGKNENGKMAVKSITLQPKVVFGAGKKTDEATINRIHQIAHANCFLANSINTKITIQ